MGLEENAAHAIERAKKLAPEQIQKDLFFFNHKSREKIMTYLMKDPYFRQALNEEHSLLTSILAEANTPSILKFSDRLKSNPYLMKEGRLQEYYDYLSRHYLSESDKNLIRR